MKRQMTSPWLAGTTLILMGAATAVSADGARDPGVRGGPPAAGQPLPGLTQDEVAFFEVGLEDFEEAEGIADGLGPRFNLDGCGGCHEQPAIGGTSPAVNPQVAVATAFGARNRVPSFIDLDGPVREARFKFNRDGTRDGGVHALFVISGRIDDTGGDATGCRIVQDDFEAERARNNVIFRIPTPMFGSGLMESISDRTLQANLSANSSAKSRAGISGRFNRNGNDGTFTRFGWKAQVVSLLLFSGEAYNVEMGITSELFNGERDPSCQYASVPNDVTEIDESTGLPVVNAIGNFAVFMRLLAPPTPHASFPGGSSSIGNGRRLFNDVGCGLCHTPTLRTGDSTVAALRDKNANLFSDLALHNMGPRLADNIEQGLARGDEFRTAPLWGLGQRLFFLHDGRTRDLLRAIQEHASSGNSQFGPSEANRVVSNFNSLTSRQRQDVLNFLRSL
jgi:CxxC motif-containing protein (DUF1111 family)